MTEPQNRTRWPRLVLVMPPDVADALGELASANLRDRRREALRLVCDGLARESAPVKRAMPAAESKR
jgi:hypothetical protein